MDKASFDIVQLLLLAADGESVRDDVNRLRRPREAARAYFSVNALKRIKRRTKRTCADIAREWLQKEFRKPSIAMSRYAR